MPHSPPPHLTKCSPSAPLRSGFGFDLQVTIHEMRRAGIYCDTDDHADARAF